MANYRLNASNPGQFYYNVFYTGRTFPLAIDIPYPFVTQGAVPIQVHSTTPPRGDACWNPGSSWPGCTITTDGGKLSPSGAPIIELADYYSGNPLVTTTRITVEDCKSVPDAGLYVSIHLDYGMKKTSGWYQADGDSIGGLDDATNAALWVPDTILNGDEYEFSFSGSSVEQTVISNNTFKKNPGVAGLTLESGSADPKGNVTVQLLNPSGIVVGTATTDADGFYQILYKHTGKAANYKVSLPQLKVSQVVQLKANGFAAVLFEDLP